MKSHEIPLSPIRPHEIPVNPWNPSKCPLFSPLISWWNPLIFRRRMAWSATMDTSRPQRCDSWWQLRLKWYEVPRETAIYIYIYTMVSWYRYVDIDIDIDIWYMIYDIWYMIHDIWYMIYNIWVNYNDLTVLPHWNNGLSGKSFPIGFNSG